MEGGALLPWWGPWHPPDAALCCCLWSCLAGASWTLHEAWASWTSSRLGSFYWSALCQNWRLLAQEGPGIHWEQWSCTDYRSQSSQQDNSWTSLEEFCVWLVGCCPSKAPNCYLRCCAVCLRWLIRTAKPPLSRVMGNETFPGTVTFSETQVKSSQCYKWLI